MSTSCPLSRSSSAFVSSFPSSRDIVKPQIVRRLDWLFDLGVNSKLLPFPEALLIVDKEELLGDHTIEFDLEKSLMKHATGRIREQFNDLRVLARVNRHGFGLLDNRIDQDCGSFQLNALNLLPIVIVFLNRHGDPWIGGQILTMT